AAPAQEEGNPYPTGTDRSTLSKVAGRSTDASTMENTRTHFIRRQHGASESELNSGPVVSMLPIGNKWKSSSVRSDCPSVERSSFRPRKTLMERKESQTSKGKKERNCRKASIRTGPKGDAIVEISPALTSRFRDFSDPLLALAGE